MTLLSRRVPDGYQIRRRGYQDSSRATCAIAWFIVNHLWNISHGLCFRWFNTLRPRQNGRQFPDDIFKCIFLNENIYTSIKISLKFVPTGTIDNIPSLFQIMDWRWSGDKPLSETMMARLLRHICVTRSQWVKKVVPYGKAFIMICISRQRAVASIFQIYACKTMTFIVG